MAIQVSALDVDHLASEFGVPDLAERLEAAGEQGIPFGDQSLILEDRWRQFVADCIRCRASVTEGGPDVELGDTTGHWNETVQKRLDRNPLLANLLTEFQSYVEQQEPGVTVTQNGWTQTYTLNGRSAGLKPRPLKGLRLYAIHNGEKLVEWVKAREDFEKGLNWLRNLPP